MFGCCPARIREVQRVGAGPTLLPPKGAQVGCPCARPVLLGVTQPRCPQVDIHIMTQPPSGEWVYFDTEISNSSGRISYVIPEERRLGIGVYPVKMVVRGDHTFADSYITVLPKGTEFVVFSIDGSFAASVSIMGSDPKVRAGAVDVVRSGQGLGQLV